MSLPLTRRTFLKGLGVSITLPFLESFSAQSILGAQAASGTFPKRFAVLYVPNGKAMDQWRPATVGSNFELPRLLKPIAEHRHDVLVVGGLDCNKAEPNGDGPGDHARAMSAFLTGQQAYKTGGANIKAGISIDQLAAQHLGGSTRFPSLELSCEYGKQDGICDSGYSCIYSNNLSWRSESTPAPKEVNPRVVFDRLFAGQDARETSDAQAQRELYNQSILDFVREDMALLNRKVSIADRRRMDEYVTSLREVERRMTAAPADIPAELANSMERPTKIPLSFREHFRIMTDLLVLAFQGDMTRISTLVFGVEGSRKSYPEAGVIDEHHAVSHHRNEPDMVEKYTKISEFHVGELAYFLSKMKSVKEGDGTLLDNSLILYGSANADGNRHSHSDLPLLLCGRGGGTLDPGRYVRYADGTPVANLYLSLLDRLGLQLDHFGDSTGRLKELSV